MQLSTKHLLGIRDLATTDIQTILDTATQFKEVLQRPIKKVPSLRDVTIINLFYENSTRTRISFELAEKRLSADTINFTASGSSVSKGESLLDTVNNILSMKVDMVVMRHSASGAPHFLARHIPAAIVNAGDGINEHPTQALLDAFSIREKLGSLEGKKVALIGDIMHSRVALSNIYLLKKMGAEVMVAGPPTLIPVFIKEAFDIRVEYNLKKALEWCDVANVLRIQLERQNQVLFSSLREYSLAYGINRRLLDGLSKEVVIMHPGPINRGVELDSDAADSKQSIILQQVENGVAVRMAVLYLLAGKTHTAFHQLIYLIMVKIALFPGTFDPMTIGHQDIIDRSLMVFDKVVIGIGRNANKLPMFSEEQRLAWAREIYQGNNRVEAVVYEGLTVTCCQEIGAKFILRGIRYVNDFEYEKAIADMNRALDNHIETVFLTCLPQYTSVASTLVRDVLRNGGDALPFLPRVVADSLKK